jgi:hypothetical protein
MARGKSPFQPSIDFGLLKIRASYLSLVFQNPADLRNAAWRRNMTRCELFDALKTVFGRGLGAADLFYRLPTWHTGTRVPLPYDISARQC